MSAKLYREHAQESNKNFIKNLKLLGRDLSKTIIVDNCSQNFELNKENGIYIKTWVGD